MIFSKKIIWPYKPPVPFICKACSLVVFDDQTFYITSCDIFVHNDLALDDCAYIMNAQDYHAEPTAKIKMKSYMGSTSYYELPVLHGFFEVLVVGCVYYSRSNEKVSVNLGSSLKYGTMESKAIYISTSSASSSSQAISTPRLLKNYLRRNAHNAWGFHLPAYFISGLTPVVPISFVSHRSQLNRKMTLHHFASRLLQLITTRSLVTSSMMKDLFLFFVGCNSVHTNGQRDFRGLNEQQQKQQPRQVYLCLLLEIAAFTEIKVHQLNGCYVFLTL